MPGTVDPAGMREKHHESSGLGRAGPPLRKADKVKTGKELPQFYTKENALMLVARPCRP